MSRLVDAIAAATAGGLLALSRNLNVWVDEGYTLDTTQHDPLDAARQAIAYELYPPLYFALLAAWRRIDASPQFARAFSVLAAALAVRDGAWAICRFAPEAEPPAVALALAANPALVWAGTEVRAYALLAWLTARMLASYHDAYVNENPDRWARARFVGWSLAGIWTHYYAGFVVAGCGAGLFAARASAERKRAFARDATIIAVGTAPLLAWLGRQLRSYEYNFTVAMPPARTLRNLAGTLAGFVLPSSGFGRFWRWALAGGILHVAFILASDRRSRQSAAAPAAIAGSGAALFGTMLQALHVPPVFPIHATAFFVPALTATAGTLRTKWRVRCYAALALFAGAVSLRRLLARGAKTGDWQRLAAHVEAREAPHEPLLVFQPEALLALRHHYRGANALEAIPVNPSRDRYDLSRFVLHGEHQIQSALRRAGASERLWLITTDQTQTLGFDFNAGVLERYVAARYRVVEEAKFLDSRVRRLVAL